MSTLRTLEMRLMALGVVLIIASVATLALPSASFLTFSLFAAAVGSFAFSALYSEKPN